MFKKKYDFLLVTNAGSKFTVDREFSLYNIATIIDKLL